METIWDLADRVTATFERLDAEEAERMKNPEYRAKVEALEAERLAAVARREREDVLNLYKARGLPLKDIPHLVAGHIRETPAVVVAREWQAGDQTVLVLSGNRGCGKTVAAGWLVHTAPRLASFMDVTKFQRLSRYDDEAMRDVEEVRLLAIDDLGMEYSDAKGSFAALFDGVFNARYAAQLRTVITTNLTAKVFRERYGERVADRIREVGRFVELDGESLRGAK